MFNILLPSIKKVKKEAILSMVSVTFESIFEIVIPLVMAKLIDDGIEIGSMPKIVRYGIMILVLVIGQAIAGGLCAIVAVRASTIFTGDLRDRIFEKVQTFGFSNIDKFSTGSLVTRTTTDLANVQRSFQMTIRGTIRGITMMIFSLVMSYVIDVKIALIFTAMIPFIILSFFIISNFAIPIFKKMFSAFDDLNNIMSENIHGIRVVKTFNREEFEYDKMKNSADNIYNLSVGAERLIAMWDPVMNISMYTLIVCICWFGAKEIVASGNNEFLGLTTGKLMSLLTYGMQMLMSLMMMSMIYVMLVMSTASMNRVIEVLKEETDLNNKEDPIYEVKTGDVEFKNVTFKYSKNSDNVVLKNINIKINSGEMVGIIGGTGSGKSSFVNLIPRLYDTSDGEVLVSGINVKDYDITTLRKNVGIVLQKNVLFSGTIASNLKFGNDGATIEEMENACNIACAMEFINEKEDKFNSIVEQGGTNFSGGQKQRLSIARTILKNPKILIFDDSTSAVDTKTDANIREGLKNLLPNTTKIIISQRIISLKYCDRIIVMENGKIVGFDSHDNLLTTCPIYKEIVDLQEKNSEE